MVTYSLQRFGADLCQEDALDAKDAELQQKKDLEVESLQRFMTLRSLNLP